MNGMQSLSSRRLSSGDNRLKDKYLQKLKKSSFLPGLVGLNVFEPILESQSPLTRFENKDSDISPWEIVPEMFSFCQSF